MNQPTLYLLVGYPGSGKTTTSRIIHDLTGAEHIWADQERRRMFPHPTHITVAGAAARQRIRE